MDGLKVLFDVDELFRDAEQTTIEEDVRRQVALAEDKWWYSNDYLLSMGYAQAEIDSVEACEPSWHREARDWSYLRNKVFGAEGSSNRA